MSIRAKKKERGAVTLPVLFSTQSDLQCGFPLVARWLCAATCPKGLSRRHPGARGSFHGWRKAILLNRL